MTELSNSELLILNTIMGYHVEFKSGSTVSDLVEAIKSQVGESMTKAESEAFIEAAKKSIEKNPEFGKYVIVESVERIDGERAPIVTFVSSDKTDAVVAFWGTTGPDEWYDNVIAGDEAVSGSEFQNVAKEYINRAAEAFDNITVTGHSKGGNKAQYVALMCEDVDRCVSFDGQGFSQEFIEKHTAKIDSRKNIITSISADKDIVNALLGSIAGEIYFVDTSKVPKEYLEGGFLYYHKPNILLNSDGQLYNTDGVEPAKIARLLNEYSVYMSSIENPEHKSKAFEIAAQLARELMGNEDSEAAMSILTKMENIEDVAIFIAYTFEFFESKNMSYDEMTEILSDVGIKIDMWYAPILWNAVFDASKTITADEFIIFAEELQKSASINGISDWQQMLKYIKEDPMRIIEIYSSLDLGKETIHKIVVNLFSPENVSSLISGLIINHPVISGCTVALLTVPAVREVLITIAGVAVSLCSIYLISKHIKANWTEIKAAMIRGAEYVKDKVAEMYTALVNKINEEINSYVADVLSTAEKIITVGERVIDLAGEKLDDFMGFMKEACKVAIKTLFMLSNPILYAVASKIYNASREPVKINMVKLRQCVNTMNRLASRVASIDSRLDNLYYQLSRNNIEQGEGIFTSLANMYNLFRADLNVDEGQAIKRKARALSELFEDCERTDKWVTSHVPQKI